MIELCRRFSIERLDVFGSAATGGFDPARSDLDFLVSFRPETESQLADLFLDLIDALRALYGRDVDVVIDRSIHNPYFRQIVDRTRVPLYAA